MSAYKITGMHSHRHPFLGAWGDLPVIAPVDAVTEALAASDAPAAAGVKDWSKIIRPLASGGVTGLVTYATCRAFSVAPKQSMQVAFVIAGLNALVNIASDWIYGEMQDLVAKQGTVPVTEVLP